MAHIVFDIGGTRTRIAQADPNNRLGSIIAYDTPQDYAEAISKLSDAVRECAADSPIEVIAGGVPGLLDAAKVSLVRAPNLPGWVGRPLSTDLSSSAGAPVFLENDAALGALGEARVGAGKDHAIVAYLAVGTGVGGARVVRGAIDAHAAGFEPGFQIIDADHTLYPPAKGHLERLVAGAGLKERTGGKEAKEIHDPEVWARAAREFAIGIANAIVHWSPHVVVLGGSLICGVDGIPVPLVSSELERLLNGVYPTLPTITVAALGREAGLVGAAEFARDCVKKSPARAM